MSSLPLFFFLDPPIQIVNSLKDLVTLIILYNDN